MSSLLRTLQPPGGGIDALPRVRVIVLSGGSERIKLQAIQNEGNAHDYNGNAQAKHLGHRKSS